MEFYVSFLVHLHVIYYTFLKLLKNYIFSPTSNKEGMGIGVDAMVQRSQKEWILNLLYRRIITIWEHYYASSVCWILVLIFFIPSRNYVLEYRYELG